MKNKMKKFLLETKGIGALAVVLYALIISYYASDWSAKFLKQIMPTVVAETSDFLPITLENGTIVEPQNAYISKTYGTETKPIYIVLDTRADSFSTDDIKENGLYISRKHLYGITSQKTEIRDFEGMPDMTFDRQLLDDGAQWIEQKSAGYIFGSLFVVLTIYMLSAALLYAALIYLLIGKTLKMEFLQTLRVTALGYVALSIFGVIAFSVGVIATFILLLAANYGVAEYLLPRSDA